MSLESINSIKQKIEESTDILVLLMNNPSLDAMASGLGLYHALKTTDKNVIIASSATINTGGWNLPGSTEIANKIGNRNLVISLSVDNKESIDKVSYNLEENGKTFNLIIQPKKGQKPLNSDRVKYSYAGSVADLIFVIDTYNFQELGTIYESEPKLFESATTVAITHNQIKTFANIHLDDNTKSSLSEVMVSVINQLDLDTKPEVATNLLAGIDVATNHLQSPAVKAETFEVIAKLMQAGGSRQAKPMMGAPTPTPAPSAAPQTNNPPSAPTENKSIPDDWLSPKIYKGSSVSKS